MNTKVQHIEFFPILDWCTYIGGVILAAHQNLMKSVQGLAHIVWHGQCYGSVHIFPIHLDSNIDVHFHINCD